MRKRNLSLMSTVLAAALSASMLICAIPVSAADASTVVLNGKEMSLDDLIKNAKEEGDLQSVGMPDDWGKLERFLGFNHRYLRNHPRRC